MKAPEIDVVVLAWNDGELLNRAIDSALRSRSVRVQVYVVDNGSQPAATVPDDDRVVLIRNEVNVGVARGRNQGAAAGDNRLICFLDSDACLLPDSLARLTDGLEPGTAMVVPRFVGQLPEESAGRAPTLGRKALRVLGMRSDYEPSRRPDNGSLAEVDFGIGACQLFVREAFDQVGRLDESYFYGPEDVDFCLRLRSAGWRIVQARDALVEHPPRRRNRRLFTRRGLQHAYAVTRHLWRHRHFRRDLGLTSR